MTKWMRTYSDAEAVPWSKFTILSITARNSVTRLSRLMRRSHRSSRQLGSLALASVATHGGHRRLRRRCSVVYSGVSGSDGWLVNQEAFRAVSNPAREPLFFSFFLDHPMRLGCDRFGNASASMVRRLQHLPSRRMHEAYRVITCCIFAHTHP